MTICILFAPVGIYTFLTQDVTYTAYFFVIGTGLIHVFYFVFLSRGYSLGNLSEVYPVARGVGPILVPVLAYLILEESISFWAFTGIILVAFGVLVVYWSKAFVYILTKPLKSFQRADLKYALATGITIAIYSIWDKAGVGYLPGFLYMYLQSLSTTIFFSLYLISKNNIKTLKPEWKLSVKGITLSAICLYSAYGLVLTALEASKVSYLWPIREISILIVVLMSYLIEKEKIRTTTIVGSIVITTGVMSISLAS